MGNVVDRETMGPTTKKVHNWVRWILGGIFFVVVLLYAGFRGYVAYQNLPSERVSFQSRTSVPFPVVTLCPVEPVPISSIIECELEKGGAPVGNCFSTIVQSTLIVEDTPHSCFTINSQGTLNSDQNADELAIQLYINHTLLPPADPILGAFVMMGTVGSTPALASGSSFVADGGKVAEVYLRMDELHALNGSVSVTYSATASSATNRNSNFSDVVDVDFWFPEHGAYVHQQYVAYNKDMWIGEVGGFTCLLTFLHMAVVWIFMFIYRRVRPEMPAKSLNDES